MEKDARLQSNMTATSDRKVFVAVASSSDESFTRKTYDNVEKILDREHVSLELQPWDSDDVQWSKYAMVILTHAYSYKYKLGEFLKWLEHLESLGVRVENSPRLVHWNMDKSYIKDLQTWGIPVTDTVFINADKFSLDEVGAIAHEKGWTSCVIKPAIGSDGEHCYRVTIDSEKAVITDAPSADLDALTKAADYILVQPFMSSVLSEGEIRSVFFDGRYCHSVIRQTPDGEFRVRKTLTSDQIKIPDDAVELSKLVMRRLLEQKKETPLYGRVDLLRNDQGQLVVSEVEILEPGLYVDTYISSCESYARAILTRLFPACGT